VSTTREIQIEDRHGGVMHVAVDGNGMIEVLVMVGEDRETVEIDETDRRDLADFLNGAR
jgi:hypothetical protein